MDYGLIGEKLSHSFSKEIHEQIFDYKYEIKEIPKGGIDAFMKAKDFKGINVTIPYKQTVIPYLDEISERAKKIGAVNTVYNRNGYLYGDNTDFSGMVALIRRNCIELQGRKVLILGSGGTSKTAFAVAEDMGARELYRVSRSAKDGAISYEDALKNHSDAEIIINTTPCGMFPDTDGMPVDIDLFPRLEGVVDAVYNPIRTKLVVSALNKGIRATGGLYMLVAQAVFAGEIFIQADISKEKTEGVYKNMLMAKENIVLTGMPGCGKSTIGKLVAKELGMAFVDSDARIVEKTGKSIPEIFESVGEQGFRDIEGQVIAELSLLQNTVIATGGGAVLRQGNVDALRRNGRIYFLDRDIEFLVTTKDRPLSSDREMLRKRYDERYGIYLRTADKVIRCSQRKNENVGMIKDDFTE
ncbi:MAG: AAA family ATPase [Clostridia bacterium]|nr:AAA family ATPase [Clostridia bacterium]